MRTMTSWYLTISQRGIWCDECSEPIGPGTPYYYSHPSHTSLCQVCGGSLKAVPSKKLVAHERAARERVIAPTLF
jgi:hypothetical protein